MGNSGLKARLRIVSDLTLTETDSGKSFRVSLGARIRLVLKENPTSGYRWHLREYESVILSLESNDFVLQSEALIGAGGMRQLCFMARGVGQSRIELRNMREWEREESAKVVFAVTIAVE